VGNRLDDKVAQFSDGKTTDESFMANMFATLLVEDPSDEPEDDEVCSNIQSPGADNNIQFGVEEDAKRAELDFAIFSVFEDVHRLRAEMQRIWMRLKDGDTTLVQATLCLAVVIELVRQAEEEALQLAASDLTYIAFSESFKGGSYRVFVGMIYNSKALGRENHHSLNDAKDSLVVTPFDELVLLPLGRTLVKFAYFWSKERRASYPIPFIPVPPLRLDYRHTPSLLRDSRYQTFEAEDELLTQLCHDMRFIEDLREGTRFRFKLFERESAKAMKSRYYRSTTSFIVRSARHGMPE
jgi:hypothetical protein